LDKIEKNQKLLEGAVNYVDEENVTPLHYLLVANPPLDLVEWLIELASNTLMVQDENGGLPLH
jgi:hypothetical protein